MPEMKKHIFPHFLSSPYEFFSTNFLNPSTPLVPIISLQVTSCHKKKVANNRFKKNSNAISYKWNFKLWHYKERSYSTEGKLFMLLGHKERASSSSHA